MHPGKSPASRVVLDTKPDRRLPLHMEVLVCVHGALQRKSMHLPYHACAMHMRVASSGSTFGFNPCSKRNRLLSALCIATAPWICQQCSF